MGRVSSLAVRSQPHVVAQHTASGVNAGCSPKHRRSTTRTCIASLHLLCIMCAGFTNNFEQAGTAERLYPGSAAWAPAGNLTKDRTRLVVANQRFAVAL
jgi:hypothetical protein